MSALVQIVNDEPVPIVDGYVTINLPQFSLTVKQAVKQIKGRGTYDAIRLKGSKPQPLHLEIIKAMKNAEPMTAQEIHYKVVANIYFDTQKTPKIKQSYFQRFHSELLWWKVIEQIGLKCKVPTYHLHMGKAQILETGVFGN